MNTTTIEKEGNMSILTISVLIVSIDNMTNVGFLNSKGNRITISDLSNYSLDIYYFIVYSIVNLNRVDSRVLDIVFSF